MNNLVHRVALHKMRDITYASKVIEIYSSGRNHWITQQKMMKYKGLFHQKQSPPINSKGVCKLQAILSFTS